MTSKNQTTYSKQNCRKLAAKCMQAANLSDCADLIDNEANRVLAEVTDRAEYTKFGTLSGLGWVKSLRKLASALRAGRAAYKVFAKGNSKLPFYSYSELPEFTCPGAGDCLRFCYSFTAWRYPDAFCRQLQNTLLMRFKRSVLAEAFAKLPANITLRLYVDGDFRDMSVLGFWFGALNRRDDIACYGYSKSWELFRQWQAQGLRFPTNYVLNLSGGSKYDEDSAFKAELKQLPITRGEFIAVPLPGGFAKGFARFEDKSYHRAIRESGRAKTGESKVFSCTGKCGDCLPSGAHACGLITLTIPILIGEHN